MEPYANRSGKSGITHYAIASDSITVQFSDGAQYLYTYSNPGRGDVDRMKRLAMQGHGLNSYISTHVKKRYERKLR